MLRSLIVTAAVVLAYLFGLLSGRSDRVQQKQVDLPMGGTIQVYQLRSPDTTSRRFVPFNVQDGDTLTRLGKGPENPDDVWLVIFGDDRVVWSCIRIE